MVNYENASISTVMQDAKRGVGDALYEMVWRYEEAMPSELPKNDPVYNSAWQDYWFEKAADKGHIEAKGRYARSLINRIFDADCHKKAKKYFEELVNDYDADKLKGELADEGIIAKLWLGIMLCQGLAIERDVARGSKLLKETDTLTNGFEEYGFDTLRNLAETYGQGFTQVGGEPSVDDLRQAIAYQRKAINRFKPEKNDPNNRGILGLAKQYLESMEKWKESKESFKDSASALNIGLGTDIDTKSVGTNPDFAKLQEKMREVTPAAKQRTEADKAAVAHIGRCMARERF